MATEPQRKAAGSAQDFVKYLVVLAVGALGFVLTMLQSSQQRSCSVLVLALTSAVVLAASIFLGMLAYGTLVSQLYEDKIDLEGSPLTWQARGQWVLFFLGICLLGIAVVLRDVFGAQPSHVPFLPDWW